MPPCPLAACLMLRRPASPRVSHHLLSKAGRQQGGAQPRRVVGVSQQSFAHADASVPRLQPEGRQRMVSGQHSAMRAIQ